MASTRVDHTTQYTFLESAGSAHDVHGSSSLNKRDTNLTLEPDRGDDDGLRSSSPPRLFEAALVRMDSSEGRTAQLGHDEMGDGTSPATSPPALSTDALGKMNDASRLSARRSSIGRDANDSDADSDASELGGDRNAFLEAFRARMTNKPQNGLDDAASAPFSSSLSDPPEISAIRAKNTVTAARSRSSSPTRATQTVPALVGGVTSQTLLPPTDEEESSSSYLTERKKRENAAASPSTRRRRIEELVARKRRDHASEKALDSDDAISSSSEVHSEDDLRIAGPSMGSSTAPNRNQRFRTSSSKGKAKDGGDKVLQFQRQSSDSSDEDDSPPVPKGNEKGPKKLSKKEIEKMHQMRARIDREAKVRAIRQTTEDRPRRVFQLTDLLSNIAAAESGPSKPKLAVPDARSPSSDPIETSESDTERRAGVEGAKDASHKSFMAKIKDKLASTRVAAERTDSAPQGSTSKEAGIAAEQAQKAKRLALQSLKLAALQNAKAVPQHNDESVALYFSDEEGDSTVLAARSKKVHAEDTDSPVPLPRDGSPGNAKRAALLTSAGLDEDVGTSRAGDQPRLGSYMEPRVKTEKPAAKASTRQKLANKHEARMSRKDLANIMAEKIRLQNVHNRRLKAPVRDEDKGPAEAVTQIDSIMQQLHQNAAHQAHGDDSDNASDSDYDPDGGEEDMAPIDFGSASEEGSEAEEEPDAEASVQEEDDNDAKAESPQQTVRFAAKRRARMLVDEDEDVNEGASEANERRVETTTAPDTSIASRSAMGPPQLPTIASNTDPVASSAKGTSIDGNPSSVFSQGLVLNADAGFSQFFAETQVASGPSQSEADVEPSGSDALAQFFLEGTQSGQEAASGVFGVLPSSSQGGGFTQLFEQGTQVESVDPLREARIANKSRKESFLSNNTGDAFSALRQGESNAARLLGDEALNLPSLEDAFDAEDIENIAALEDEALKADEDDRLRHLEIRRKSSNAAYLNRDGFFTQTRPDEMMFADTQTQSLHAGSAASPEAVIARGTFDNSQPRRRRFRRAASPALHDQPVSIEGVIIEEDNEKSEEEDVESLDDRTSHDSPEAKTAFDALRAGQQAQATKSHDRGKGASIFLEGEAEESDDEEATNQRGRRDNRGGLDGVFSDQDSDSGSEDSGDDDDKDVENLIDEEVDEDEDRKDKLARARYLQDIDADDQAAQALHEKAIRGGFRTKRRGRNEDGTLGDFLEDDYEDDWLEKKARNPYGSIAKKRRLQGKDGMDLLAEQEESQAFVLQYRDSHHQGDILDKYAFLQSVQDDEATMQSLYEEGSYPSGHGATKGVEAEASDEEGSDKEQPRKMTRSELQEEIAAIRRRQKRRKKGMLDDEDIEAEEKRLEAEREISQAARIQHLLNRVLMADCSDDEMDDAQQLKDRLNGAEHADELLIPRQAEADDDDEEAGVRLGFSGLGQARQMSERERVRLQRIAKDYENEPDWDSLRSSVGRSKGSSKNTLHSTTSNSSALRDKGRATRKEHAGGATGPSRAISSKLQGVMSRQSQFSHDDTN